MEFEEALTWQTDEDQGNSVSFSAAQHDEWRRNPGPRPDALPDAAEAKRQANAWADSTEEQARFQSATENAENVTVTQEERDDLIVARSSSGEEVL